MITIDRPGDWRSGIYPVTETKSFEVRHNRPPDGDREPRTPDTDMRPFECRWNGMLSTADVATTSCRSASHEGRITITGDA